MESSVLQGLGEEGLNNVKGFPESFREFIIAANFVGTMNAGTYPGNLSWPRIVAGVMLVLTSMGLFCGRHAVVPLGNIWMCKKCVSLSGNFSTMNCI
jgi:hypothetical protein